MTKKIASHKSKKTPSFWWDFGWKGRSIYSIVIQSDNEKCPVVAEWVGTKHIQAWSVLIDLAETVINDLNAGRITIKQCMEKY